MSDVSNPIIAARVRFPGTQVPSSEVNTLDDYEEGTWTPADSSGAALTFTSVVGRYSKIGRKVTAWATFIYPATADGSNAAFSGLPFTVNNSTGSRGGVVTYSTESTLRYALATINATTVSLYVAAGTAITNATMSGDTVVVEISYEASA